MRVGFNPKKGRIKTDVGITIDRAFLAHIELAGAVVPALSATAVLPLTNLGAAVQAAVVPAASPAVPRALSIVSNKSNAAGNVVVTGKNYAGKTITETLALNGTTTRNGAKAFKSVSSISLPVQTNTPVAQVETATAVGTVTTAGRAKCTVTSAGMPGSPLHVPFDVELEDGAEEIAAALRNALAGAAAVAAKFNISGEGASVVLTAKLPAANDTTLNIAISDGEGEGASEGVTTAAASASTTAGVDYDKVSVGFNDILGLPYMLAHNTVIAASLNNVRETTAPTVTVSTTAVESNTVKLHSALDGTAVDIYLIV